MSLSSRFARVHYAWIVAATAFAVVLVVAGVRSAVSVMIAPIEADLGWSAATISIAVAINIALYGALGPFAAALMQTVGVRVTVLVALCILIVASAATSLIHTPLQLALTWGVGIGAGVGLVSMVFAAQIASRWFVKQRGLVLGALTGAVATGQLIFLPTLAFVAAHVGWRAVGLTIAVVLIAILLPVALLMRDRPEAIGLLPYGADPDTEHRAPSSSGNPLSTAFRVLKRCVHTRDWWIVAGTFFICGASTNGLIGTHFIPACTDHGIAQVQAAGLLATMGVFSLIGTTLSGFLSDRFSARSLLFWYYGLRGLALLFVPSVLNDAFGVFGLPLFLVFYGMDWLATVPPNMRALIGTFGKEDAPIAYGWTGVAHQLGAGSVALVAGIIRTQSGSYQNAFIISGSLCVVAAVAVLGLGAQPRAASPIGVARPATAS